MVKATAPRRKAATKIQWRVAPAGVRFTVKRGREGALDRDGKLRTFRTRDAAARVARELNSR
jgi:hypothetical protein